MASPIAEAIRSAGDRQTRDLNKLVGAFKVITVTPEFTVQMDGAADAYGVPIAVLGRRIPGLTYIVGTTGFYVHVQGQRPYCVPLEVLA